MEDVVQRLLSRRIRFALAANEGLKGLRKKRCVAERLVGRVRLRLKKGLVVRGQGSMLVERGNFLLTVRSRLLLTLLLLLRSSLGEVAGLMDRIIVRGWFGARGEG